MVLQLFKPLPWPQSTVERLHWSSNHFGGWVTSTCVFPWLSWFPYPTDTYNRGCDVINFGTFLDIMLRTVFTLTHHHHWLENVALYSYVVHVAGTYNIHVWTHTHTSAIPCTCTHCAHMYTFLRIQWNTSKVDTIETSFFVHCIEVSAIQGVQSSHA